MIVITNLLVCYLIIEISFTNPLLITKLIILGVEFKVPKETSFTSDGIAKPVKITKPNQCVPRQPQS